MARRRAEAPPTVLPTENPPEAAPAPAAGSADGAPKVGALGGGACDFDGSAPNTGAAGGAGGAPKAGTWGGGVCCGCLEASTPKVGGPAGADPPKLEPPLAAAVVGAFVAEEVGAPPPNEKLLRAGAWACKAAPGDLAGFPRVKAPILEWVPGADAAACVVSLAEKEKAADGSGAPLLASFVSVGGGAGGAPPSAGAAVVVVVGAAAAVVESAAAGGVAALN